jgi:hypothetical protein
MTQSNSPIVLSFGEFRRRLRDGEKDQFTGVEIDALIDGVLSDGKPMNAVVVKGGWKFLPQGAGANESMLVKKVHQLLSDAGRISQPGASPCDKSA